MKKTIIILTTLALTALWGQKEIPVGGNENEETASERLNGYQSLTIDPETESYTHLQMATILLV